MKLIYSQLQKLLPNLDVEPQKLRDDLTLIGHFANYYELISDTDFVVDLDIKVNRGDALGYYGLARDLSVFYQIPLVEPSSSITLPHEGSSLPITVSSPDVRRVMAISLSGITVQESPEWLREFLKIHGINSINNIVDLTNYAMLIYGIPNHAFDTAKTGSSLIWENQAYPEFTTLDGTTVTLPKTTLVISNGRSPLCLSFIGGNNSGISPSTTDIILEMATYDRSRVRRDSRGLKIITEAGLRLEKDLDSNLIPQAFAYLVSLIIENGAGEISSAVFDYYPVVETALPIEFDFQKPSLYSGITIPEEFARLSLESLGCTINSNIITPPTIRPDIKQEEDLIEEVIRFWGYQKIPTSEPLSPKALPDITPKILYLIEELKDKLVALGYDEVRTWPLVAAPSDPATAIHTQNSINSEVTVLRQSIVDSLKSQLDQYSRFKLPHPQFFEIGKIFRQKDGKYIENYALGLYHHSATKLTSDLQQLGLTAQISGNFAQVILDDLPQPETYTPQTLSGRSIELKSQIVTLDVNITSTLNPTELLAEYSKKISPEYLWEIVVTDHYQDRYTLRVSYYNLDSETAKKIHFEAFDIKL